MAPRIEISPTVKIDDAETLSRVYTPGVANDCRAIAEDPAAAWRLTVRGNSVAVVSDGSAVLGLGDIGPRAALPVLEGKAALYKRFAGIDAWPLCLDVRDVPEMIRCISAVAAGFGLPAPARSPCSTVMASCTQAGRTSRARRDGWPSTPSPDRRIASWDKSWTTRTCSSGSARPACSASRTWPGWQPGPSCSRWPIRTRRSTRRSRAATWPWWRLARSDQPNQINNVLAFPGIFRGLLDGGAADLAVAAQCAAAHAIADTVSEDELDAEHIVPDVFDENLVPAVAQAVMNA